MKNKRWIRIASTFATTAVFTCLTLPAQASDTEPTGLDLITRCNAVRLSAEAGEGAVPAETSGDYGYCLGYLVGFVGGFAARDVLGEESRFCPPAEARVIDFVDALQRWLTAHPKGLEGQAPLVTIEAFHASFPCADDAREDQ